MPEHVRHYQIAGITVQVESDLPITETTFDRRFAGFRVAGPGTETVTIRHHFGLPDLAGVERGEEVYRKPPWAIYRQGGSWIYHGIGSEARDSPLHRVAVFSADHSCGEIYNDDAGKRAWLDGGVSSLTMFPSDQILLARLLADRDGCLLHSGAVALDAKGLVFVGHSDAGKSTTVALIREELGDRAKILCDDRNIVRRWQDGLRVHGTWSHGDIPDVSPASAPLCALLFLEQYDANEIVPIHDRKQIWQRLLATLIKPLATADWWHKEMDLLQQISAAVPCYEMRFDQSGAVVPQLEKLAQ